MEMMGLAIIVILLSMALLFVIRFVVLKEPTQHTKEYAQSELAANFLNTLMETNAPRCSNVKFETLFMDCVANNANGGNIPCMGDTGFVTSRSCEYLRETIPLILEQTFDKWKIKYRFIATTSSSDDIFDSTALLFDKIDSGCTDSQNRKVKVQPLPSNPPLNVALFICD